jgi:hypothetical protein
MKKRPTGKDWLPLARTEGGSVEAPTGEAFRPEWIDFEKGIRVGNLEPHERITRILKYRLEDEYGEDFVTDRWGRGVYWQWICWVPRSDRDAKPISSNVNFGCAKLFISQDRTERIFQCGLQVERGALSGSRGEAGIVLQSDWDWHRLMKQCAAGTPLDEELYRLVRREGFVARLWGWPGGATFTAGNFQSALQIREASRKAPRDGWAGFQLYYPMPESEIRASGGYDLVQAIMGAFAEVVPAMNLCMQVTLTSTGPVSLRARGSGIPSGRAPGSPPPVSGQ